MSTTSPSDLRAAALAVLSPGFVGTELPAWLDGLLSEGLAGVWLFGHNITSPEQCRALTEQIRAVSAHALVCADEEGGSVTRLHHQQGSPWPGAWALGQVDDVAATRAVALGLGRQLASVGIDTGAAPVADVNSEPENPVIGTRSFGADPELVARHVAATVKGLAEAGVLSCAKHFPGHGSTTQDSHVTLPTLQIDDRLLAERELAPFRAAVESGVDLVMTGHLVVPSHGDLPATLNPSLIRLLREDLGFTGVICTDALDMEAVAATWGRPRAAVLAIAAGVDLICVGNPVFPGTYDAHEDVLRLADALVTAVQEGDLDEARLLEAGARVRVLGQRQAARRNERHQAVHGGAEQQAEHRGGQHHIEADEDDLGVRVAARAVLSAGAPQDLRGALVVGASAVGNIASGARQEVVLRVLADRFDGEVQETLAGDATRTQGGPLVLVIDDHTDLTEATVRDGMARATAVVHTGIRDLPADLHPRWLVRTYGGGRASALAVADALDRPTQVG